MIDGHDVVKLAQTYVAMNAVESGAGVLIGGLVEEVEKLRTLSAYEIAKLRLQAFGLLDGWGKQNEKGLFIPHDLERRKELAIGLVEWAVDDAFAASEGKK